ncbi:ANTAR domain-containing protein [Streptomyces massasporeus]
MPRSTTALGVLLAVHRLPPTAGFEVLREVSQRTNRKLHAVAQAFLDWALGQPLPSAVGRELDVAVQRAQDPTQRQALTSSQPASQPHP